MESSGNSDNNHETLDDVWEWQGDDYCLETDPQPGATECLWDNIDENEDSVLHILGDHTPIKECGELHCGFMDSVEKNIKDPGGCSESSLRSRRRTLQFGSDASDSMLVNEQSPSEPETLTQEDCRSNLQGGHQWCSSFEDDKFLFSDEVMDQSAAEEWYQGCLIETEMCNSSSGTNGDFNVDDQANISVLHGLTPESQNSVSQTPTASASASRKGARKMAPKLMLKLPTTSTVKILKGRKSNICVPPEVTTSVTYPFNLIKPFENPGNSTLKDINQRIRSRPRDPNDTDEAILYPTSAFSGKPVVSKTKLQTGGKGSITILRTKG